MAFIAAQAGGAVLQRWYTDTGPVLEREMAQRAGLGWIYLAGLAVVIATLVWEHAILRPSDLSRLDVAFFNLSIRELHCKIVYWGQGRCGKTSNLQYIHARVPPTARGKLITIDAQGFVDLKYERTFARDWDVLAHITYGYYGFDGGYLYDYAESGEEPYLVVNKDRYRGEWWAAQAQVGSGPRAPLRWLRSNRAKIMRQAGSTPVGSARG
jgi:hypothetical protein